IGTATSGNTLFWAFLVDINQAGSGDANLLDLTHFQLFSCGSATYVNLSGCTSFFNLFGGAVNNSNPALRPTVSDQTLVTFDYRNHTGSGAGDILMFVPVLANFPTSGNVALLDGWGSPPGTHADNDGFQEWINIKGVECPTCGGGGGIGQVPEPASLLL